MYTHFIYIVLKKDKEKYLFAYKSKEEDLIITELNKIIYKELYNLSGQDTVDENINYFEIFYLKKGLIIKEDIWKDIIKIYMQKLDIITLINEEYIKELYAKDIIYFNISDYNKELNKYICDYYCQISNI